MTDTPFTSPTRQAVAAVDRSLPGKVTGRLRKAVDLMVWQAQRRADAAQLAGMTDESLRSALRKPHVMGYLQGELRVLREAERPKTHGRLVELRDQNQNMNAAVSAAKALETISDDVRPNAATASPGVTIRIINQVVSPAPSPVIDVTPQHEPEPEPSLPASTEPIFRVP